MVGVLTMTQDVTDWVEEGFVASTAAPNPHLWSSTAWEAFEVGRFLALEGRDFGHVAASRGSTYKIDGDRLTVAIIYESDGHRVKLED